MEKHAFYDDLYPFTWTRPVDRIRLGILTLAEKWERMVPGGRPDSIPANAIPGAVPATLRYPWQIFQMNDAQLRADFALLTKDRISQPIPPTVQATHPDAIFIEEGAILEHVILNASTGPIYIGSGAHIMDGAVIRGPFAACEGATVKMGAKIYGATTLGPYCSAGGELKNVVMFGYSNKGHEGYLGDAVIGEWCNLGAGCSASNVKNTGGDVKVWHQASGQCLPVGLKCGLLMGDYSRAAINTSFNTGTVVGVAANVFGFGLTPMHIPSFSWGSERYRLPQALEHIRNWKKMKNRSLSDDEIRSLSHIFDTLK